MADVTLGVKNNGLGGSRGINGTTSDRMNTSATVIYVSRQVVKESYLGTRSANISGAE